LTFEFILMQAFGLLLKILKFTNKKGREFKVLCSELIQLKHPLVKKISLPIWSIIAISDLKIK